MTTMEASSDQEPFDASKLVAIPYDLEEDDLESNRSLQRPSASSSSASSSSSSSNPTSLRGASSGGSSSHQREFASQTDSMKRGYVVRSIWNRFADYVNERANLWMRVAMLIVGPIFVFVAVSLIGIVTYIHLASVLPMILDNNSFSLLAVFHYAVSLWLLFNLVFNYIMCIITPPGVPPPTKVDEETLEHIRKDFRSQPGVEFSRYCKTCKQAKPPRSHHCHICNKCILKMDHHCPWINNCVGHFNHKYFVLFMLYMCVGCGYCAICTYSPFMQTIDFDVAWNSTASRGGVIFQFILTVSVMIAVGALLLWHFYLLLTNQTTIEFYHNSELSRHASARGQAFVNEYDLGYRRNFQLFFGHSKYICSFLIPSTKPSPGDGIVYESRRNTPYNV